MAQTVYHAYTQTVGDGTATSVVRPSDWNSSHVLAGDAFVMGVSTMGSTAGATGVTGSRVVLVGGNEIGLSQTTDANGATITIYEPARYVGYFGHNTQVFASSTTFVHVDTSVSIARVEIPDDISFTRIDIPVSISLASSGAANTAALNLSATMVLYTRSGGTLTPFLGTVSNTTYTWASNTSNFANLSGNRMLSFGLATALSPGEYYVAVALSTHSTSSIGTATTALRASINMILGTSFSAQPWSDMGSASAATINLAKPLQGVYNASISATNQTLSQSGITQTGATAVRANLPLYFRNF